MVKVTKFLRLSTLPDCSEQEDPPLEFYVWYVCFQKEVGAKNVRELAKCPSILVFPLVVYSL